jgi:predicted nucleic acid-binding Zn ribbon protein
MRRRAPRTMGPALEQLIDRLAPATTLARAQRAWPEVAGAVVAREAEPVAERDGVLTIACESSVWAQEIELLSGDLLGRLNGALAEPGGTPPLRSLRVRTGR